MVAAVPEGHRDGDDRVARLVPVAVCALLAGLLVTMAMQSGGFFPQEYTGLGAVALATSALALPVVAVRWRPTVRTVIVLVSLFGLAAWAGVSAGWSPDATGARLDMQRDLAYAGAFLLAAVAVGNGRHATLLVRLVVAALVGVSAVALLSRLEPTLFHVDPGLLAISEGRLAYPLTYWNAQGAVAAMALIGCIALAADVRSHTALRSLAAAGGVVAGAVLYLTISRGSVLAFAVALAVVLAISPRRMRLAVSAIPVLAASAVAIAVLHAHPVLVDEPGTLAAQARAGASSEGALAVAILAAGAVQALLCRVPALNSDMSRYGRGRRGAAAVWALCGALVALVVVFAYAASSDTVEGQTAGGIVDVRGFVNREYRAFMDAGTPPPVGQSRLASARSSRSEAYRVALHGFRRHPLRGDGAAGYAVRWARERRVPETFRNAHSLELETADELGLVGLLLLGGILVPLGLGLRGLRRSRGGLTRTQAAAAGGITVVWMLHSAVDWDWQMAAVTLPALLCGAGLLAEGRRVRRAPGANFARPRPARARAHA